MRIHVFTILRNEEKMLPFFLRHYCQFAEKIVIFDDNSEDRTREIAGKVFWPWVKILTPSWTGIDDSRQAELYSTAYREHSRGRADWVMCVDSDEFVYHKSLEIVLQGCLERDVQIIAPLGFEMVHDSFPTDYPGQLYEVVKNGFCEHWYSKPCVFRPHIDMSFTPGRHECNNLGVNGTSGLKLLHFRYLGECYCASRNARNASRLTPENKIRSYGTHVLPDAQGSHSMGWYKEKAKESGPCLD